MTAPGGGTVGSILGYLRLDRSDWDREIDEANRKADELGRNSPDVRIRTNSAAAIAQLSAVAAAARRLQDAQGREVVAEQRLAELRGKSGVAQSRILRAEQQLAAARRAVAEATIVMARAQSTGTDETDRATRSTDRSRKSLGLLADTLIFLGPAVIPILGAVAGAAAGLAPTLASAALAAFGVRDAWKAGALEGTQFAQQVNAAKDQLDQLKQTAAAGVLPGLSSALRNVSPLFDLVNGDVGIFSRQIGQIVAALAPALVQILTDMQPLFTTLGNVLMIGANHLAAWAASGTGVTSFVNYVVAELPTVLSTLGQLVQLIGHLGAALAPIGHVVLEGIGLIAGILNAIPTGVLTGLAAAALTAYAAFKIFSGAVAIFTAVSRAAEAFSMSTAATFGVIGALAVAVGILGFAMGGSSDKAQAAKQAMDSYKDSVEESTDALNKANQAQTLKNLRDQGALTMLDELHSKNLLLGVSYDDLVMAVNGNEDAYKRLIPGLKDAKSHLGGIVNTADKLAGVLNNNRQGLQDQIQSTTAYNKAADQMNQKLTVQDQVANANAKALGTTRAAYDAATQAQRKSTEQTQQQTVQWQLANDAGSLLAATLDRLSGKNLSYAQSQNTFDSALANMGDHVTAQGKKITFTTRSINNMSAASVALRGQLLQQVQSAEQTSESYGKLTGSSEQARQKLIQMRQQIIDNAVAHGVDRQAVTSYIDSVLKIPKKVPPTKLDVDKAKADKKLADLKAYLNTLTSKAYHINVEMQTQVLASNQALALLHGKTFSPTKNAAGGTLGNKFAEGGTYGTIAGPGGGLSDLVPFWGSNGEEVIRAAQAAKWRPFLKAINAGLQPPRVTAAPRAQAAPSLHGARIVIDAGSIGMLTGYIDQRADGRVRRAVVGAMYQ